MGEESGEFLAVNDENLVEKINKLAKANQTLRHVVEARAKEYHIEHHGDSVGWRECNMSTCMLEVELLNKTFVRL